MRKIFLKNGEILKINVNLVERKAILFSSKKKQRVVFGRNRIQRAIRYFLFRNKRIRNLWDCKLRFVRARIACISANFCLTLSADTCKRCHGAGDGLQSFTIRYIHDGAPHEGVVGNVQVFRGKERRWSHAARQLVASPRRRQGAGEGEEEGSRGFSSIA